MNDGKGSLDVGTRIRMKPDERRRMIVEAAFTAIANDGFEGLRTRDIAETVRVNSATLHHYFPTKDDLISAVAEHLGQRLRTEKSPIVAGEATDTFGRQFDDLIFYHFHMPEILAVYREFVARAPRDLEIREIVAMLHRDWRQGVASNLKLAQSKGLLRGDIDVEAFAGVVLCVAWGVVAQIFASTAELLAAVNQLRALVAPIDLGVSR